MSQGSSKGRSQDDSAEFAADNGPNGGVSAATNSPLATVFQDAYQKAMTIRRLDEQIGQLAARRKAMCEELKQIQGCLNEEFTRLLDTETQISGDSPNGARVMVSVHQNTFAGRNAEAAA
ncbi:MAG TPA: hypothetical protein PLD59_03530 [Tepidisphaeraceae bacterium]|nr:hypothetical protein [Tepidisphaeraceae bacterium]